MDYNKEVREGYFNKLKSKLFGLLCEYEKGRDWEAFLDSILIELLGFEKDERTINFYILYHKIAALRYLSHKHFRATVFDCMSIITKQEQET